MDPNLIHLAQLTTAAPVVVQPPDFITSLEQGLGALASAAVIGGIGYLVTWAQSHLHIAKGADAETTIRNAAATAAGKLAATVPAASAAAVAASPTTSIQSLFSIGDLQNAASKIISDLPAEIKLTGYNPQDITDMILGYLPAILGAVNPALGTAATVIKDIVTAKVATAAMISPAQPLK